MNEEIKVAREIAEHIFALGGPDLRTMSDDKLIAHITDVSRKIAETMKRSGVSISIVSETFQAFGKALQKRDVDDAQRQW